MIETFQSLMVVILLLSNFLLLGTARTQPLYQWGFFQSIFVTLSVPLFVEDVSNGELAATVVLLILTRWLILPFLIRRAIKLTHLSPALKPLVNPAVSLLLLTAVLALVFWLSNHLPLPEDFTPVAGLIPAAVITLFTGCFLMMARYLAFTQVMGLLVLGNGIVLLAAAFGLFNYAVLPIILLLDIPGMILLAGIILFGINQSFDHIEMPEEDLEIREETR